MQIKPNAKFVWGVYHSPKLKKTLEIRGLSARFGQIVESGSLCKMGGFPPDFFHPAERILTVVHAEPPSTIQKGWSWGTN